MFRASSLPIIRNNMNVKLDNVECKTQFIQTKFLNECRWYNRLTWMWTSDIKKMYVFPARHSTNLPSSKQRIDKKHVKITKNIFQLTFQVSWDVRLVVDVTVLLSIWMAVMHPPSGTTVNLTKPHIPRDLNLQQRCCESLKSHNLELISKRRKKHTIWPCKCKWCSLKMNIKISSGSQCTSGRIRVYVYEKLWCRQCNDAGWR
jgi:hypothetical protein